MGVVSVPVIRSSVCVGWLIKQPEPLNRKLALFDKFTRARVESRYLNARYRRILTGPGLASGTLSHADRAACNPEFNMLDPETVRERVELVHRATNRDIFARGALHVATRLVGRPAGSYRVRDLL